MISLDGLPSDLGAHLRRETIRATIKRPTAPLRVLIVGDLRYNSEFIFSVHQGFTLLGHWVGVMDVRSDIGAIVQKARDLRPDIAFFHMLMWSPVGQGHTHGLLQLCADMRRAWGTRVLIHDGDARAETRYPHDISASVDLALCNHRADRSAWNVPQVCWPYGCFVQREPAAPVKALRCDLAFAGRQGPGLYQGRTELLAALKARLGDRFKIFPNGQASHTLFITPELAASAVAVLGHARPETVTLGWKDVRYWQYPGAGAALLHDDLTGPLVPGEHFIPYETMNAESVIDGIEVARRDGDRIRCQAFAYLQQNHSSVVRANEVLHALGMC